MDLEKHIKRIINHLMAYESYMNIIDYFGLTYYYRTDLQLLFIRNPIKNSYKLVLRRYIDNYNITIFECGWLPDNIFVYYLYKFLYNLYIGLTTYKFIEILILNTIITFRNDPSFVRVSLREIYEISYLTLYLDRLSCGIMF